MVRHNSELVGSGRTTRMLAEAKALALSGRAVYIIAANCQHASLLESRLGNERFNLGIKVEVPTRIGNFDWDTVKLIGTHSNCVVLVDHYAIETHFADVLEMLHRFD